MADPRRSKLGPIELRRSRVQAQALTTVHVPADVDESSNDEDRGAVTIDFLSIPGAAEVSASDGLDVPGVVAHATSASRIFWCR